MDTDHPTHPLFTSMKRGWEDSSGEVRVLITPQLMGILATRIGGKLRIVCLLLVRAKSYFLLALFLSLQGLLFPEPSLQILLCFRFGWH